MNQRIVIRKVEESERTVLYAFRPEGGGEGLLLIDKESGKIIEVQPVDDERGPRFFRRAGRKVHQLWRQGEYPAETSWGAPKWAATVRPAVTGLDGQDEKQSV